MSAKVILETQLVVAETLQAGPRVLAKPLSQRHAHLGQVVVVAVEPSLPLVQEGEGSGEVTGPEGGQLLTRFL